MGKNAHLAKEKWIKLLALTEFPASTGHRSLVITLLEVLNVPLTVWSVSGSVDAPFPKVPPNPVLSVKMETKDLTK